MNSAEGPEIISLGCRLNISEGENMRAMLAGEQKLVVVNSCAVTAEAVRQTRQAIRRARRDNPDARLLVTGCAAETERAAISQMDEVDGIIANSAKLDPRAWNVAEAPAAPIARKRTRAFVAVQNGCDHACTFCIIPQGRGPSRSLPIAEVLKEVEGHLTRGALEIVLTGVDVTSWGHDLADEPKLGTMVAAILAEFPELKRIRMSSLDGVEIDPLLEELFMGEARLMPHIHLSLQHGHDLILKRMKRRHLRDNAVQLIARLKARRPEIAVGADIIAGFPTENEAMHHENLSILTELDIVHGHIFPYSPRPGTPAALMPQVERAVIKRRAAELREEVMRLHAAWLSKQVGKPMQVLAERDGTGYAPNFARIALPHGTAAGTVVSITPTRAEEGMLI